MLFADVVNESIPYLLNDILFISNSLKCVYVKANDINVYTFRLNVHEEQITSIRTFDFN